MKIERIVKFLKCPYCNFEELNQELEKIVCPRCQTIFDIKNGVPIMIIEERLNDQEKRQIEIFDRHYLKNFSNKHELERWQESMIRRVINLDKVNTYLDIGCSADAYAVNEAARRKGWLSIGINVSIVAMIQAKARADRQGLADKTAFIVASAERLPFKKKLFDYISLISVLEHIKDDQQVIAGLARAVKKNGYTYICVPNGYRRIWPWLWPIYYILDKFAGHVRHYTIYGLNKKMDESGFRLESVKYNGHLIKLWQLILDKLNLINNQKWWKIEERDINHNSRGLQLNAMYRKQ